jgi:hypothetical protein
MAMHQKQQVTRSIAVPLPFSLLAFIHKHSNNFISIMTTEGRIKRGIHKNKIVKTVKTGDP